MPVPELAASSGTAGGAQAAQTGAVDHGSRGALGETVDRDAQGAHHAGRRQGIAGPDGVDDLDRAVADGADQQGALGDRLVAGHPHAAAQRTRRAKGDRIGERAHSTPRPVVTW